MRPGPIFLRALILAAMPAAMPTSAAEADDSVRHTTQQTSSPAGVKLVNFLIDLLDENSETIDRAINRVSESGHDEKSVAVSVVALDASNDRLTISTAEKVDAEADQVANERALQDAKEQIIELQTAIGEQKRITEFASTATTNKPLTEPVIPAEVKIASHSIKEAIEHTLATNPEILIEVERSNQASEGVNRARAAWYPQLEFKAGKGKEERLNPTTISTYGGTVKQDREEQSVTLTQMLFDGFATYNEVNRNLARVDSAGHRVAATSEQVSLKAIESYLEVLRQREVFTLTQDNLTVHERTYDQIKLRTASGVGRKADQDQIEARLALARSNLTAAEANMEVAQINYKLVIGELPKGLSRPTAPEDRLLPATADSAVSAAIESHRLLHAARSDISAAQAQVAAARGVLSPRLDLEIGKSKTNYHTPIDDPLDNNTYAMLRLRINLFAGGADVARVSEARHLAQESKEILRRAERQMEQSVRLSWNAYRSARDRLPNLRQHADSSRLTRDAYVKQFAIGQRSLLDLLDSENEYFTAQTNYVNGQFVELFARYRLLADTGVLLSALDIEPPAQADPARLN